LHELQDVLQTGNQRDKSPVLNRNISVKRAKSPKQVPKLKGSTITQSSVIRNNSKLKSVSNPYAQKQDVVEAKATMTAKDVLGGTKP